MNSKIGLKAVAAVEQTIEHSQEINLSWKTKERDGMTSMVGCFQVFKDKPQRSTKVGLVAFYPLHITSLNYFQK